MFLNPAVSGTDLAISDHKFKDWFMTPVKKVANNLPFASANCRAIRVTFFSWIIPLHQDHGRHFFTSIRTSLSTTNFRRDFTRLH